MACRKIIAILLLLLFATFYQGLAMSPKEILAFVNEGKISEEHPQMSKSTLITAFSTEKLEALREYYDTFKIGRDGEGCQENFEYYRPGNIDYSSTCGSSKAKVSSRIIGGEDVAYTTQYNYAAKIFIWSRKGWAMFSGIIISRNYVATSAFYCHESFVGEDPRYVIWAGTVDIYEASPNVQVTFSEQFIIHPEYNVLSYDICMLKVYPPFNFTDHVGPACYAGPNTAPYELTTAALKNDVVATYVGYGSNKGSDGFFGGILRKQDQRITNLTDCDREVGVTFRKEQYCCATGNRKKQTCWEDQGSALITARHDGYRIYNLVIGMHSITLTDCFEYSLATKFITPKVSQFIETVSGVKPKSEHKKSQPPYSDPEHPIY